MLDHHIYKIPKSVDVATENSGGADSCFAHDAPEPMPTLAIETRSVVMLISLVRGFLCFGSVLAVPSLRVMPYICMG